MNTTISLRLETSLPNLFSEPLSSNMSSSLRIALDVSKILRIITGVDRVWRDVTFHSSEDFVSLTAVGNHDESTYAGYQLFLCQMLSQNIPNYAKSYMLL